MHVPGSPGSPRQTFPNLTSLQLLDNDLRTLQQLERLDPITSNLKGLYLGKNPLLQNASKAALAAWLKSHGERSTRSFLDLTRVLKIAPVSFWDFNLSPLSGWQLLPSSLSSLMIDGGWSQKEGISVRFVAFLIGGKSDQDSMAEH